MSDKNADKQNKPSYQNTGPIERQLALIVLITNLIPTILLIATLWFFEVSIYLLGIIGVILLFLILFTVSYAWRRAQFQFRSLHNLLDAIARGDYSIRGAHTQHSGAFGELVGTINSLAQTLQRQRMQSEESQLLVKKVIDQIDVAIIAWDQNDKIRLVNPAASSLFDPPLVSLQSGRPTELPNSLAFANDMKVGETQVKDLTFAPQPGRYRLHLERFFTEGDTHNLLFLTNVSSILRSEERRAWRNLVRVLSHEINNSLAPLKSFSNALKTQVEKREQDEVLKGELLDGIAVIGNRANSLADFVQSYHKIAKLPDPQKQPSDLKQLMRALVKLFPDESIALDGDSITLAMDSAQIEQVMINLLKNAVEASDVDNPIEVAWRKDEQQVVVSVRDNGEGIQNPENLFTPYYTTKQSGSGIGLVFCQQVIEAHGGYLTISNRTDANGCEASFNLPL